MTLNFNPLQKELDSILSSYYRNIISASLALKLESDAIGKASEIDVLRAFNCDTIEEAYEYSKDFWTKIA